MSSIKSSQEKDATFTTSTPTVPKNLSGSRVNEVLPFMGRVFPSGGTEGGGRVVGWVIRKGFAVPALEESYSPGAGMRYTYYTPDHPQWSETVDLILRLVQLAKEKEKKPSSTPAPAEKPISGTTPAVSTTTALSEQPWFWPAVVFGGALAFLYLRRK